LKGAKSASVKGVAENVTRIKNGKHIGIDVDRNIISF
jgi:hypothetical protein